MKRFFALILAAASLFFILPVSAADTAEKPIEVYYLGKKLEFPVPPQLIGNTTMVPMRTIFEALGYRIIWEDAYKKVHAFKDKDFIELTVGNVTALVNGSAVSLSHPPVIVNSTVLVPLRFIGEASGYDVQWYENRTVIISKPEDTKKENSEWKNLCISELTSFKSRLSKFHNSLNSYMSAASFSNAVDNLINKAPSLTAREIKFEFLKLINSIKDVNTNATCYSPTNELYNINSLKEKSLSLPLVFFQFSHEIYLIDAASDFKNFIGKRLTSINGIPINDVLKKISPILPSYNESQSKKLACEYLRTPEYLRLVGISKDVNNTVIYTFNDLSITISSNMETGQMESVLNDKSFNFPTSYKNSKQDYWYTILNEKNVVYIKYNANENIATAASAAVSNPDVYIEKTSFKTFADEVYECINKQNIDTLILDLRDYSGDGDINLLHYFITKIMKHKINSAGHFYVLVGRNTFSTAVVNATIIKKLTNAIFVGEPSGGNPGKYGSPQTFIINSLGLKITYPSAYYSFGLPRSIGTNMPVFSTGFTAPVLKPSITVEPKAASFFAGKDDFLEAVFKDMESR